MVESPHGLGFSVFLPLFPLGVLAMSKPLLEPVRFAARVLPGSEVEQLTFGSCQADAAHSIRDHSTKACLLASLCS